MMHAHLLWPSLLILKRGQASTAFPRSNSANHHHHRQQQQHRASRAPYIGLRNKNNCNCSVVVNNSVVPFAIMATSPGRVLLPRERKKRNLAAMLRNTKLVTTNTNEP